MGAVKDEISSILAGRLADELAAAWPEFPRQRFMAGLGPALEPLGLMARVDLLADRLAVGLPEVFGEAGTVLWRALESPTFTGWMPLPCGTFVARRGIDHPDEALRCSPGSPRGGRASSRSVRSSSTSPRSPTTTWVGG